MDRRVFPALLYTTGLSSGLLALTIFAVGTPGNLSPVTKILALLILSIFFLTVSLTTENMPELIYGFLALYCYTLIFYYIYSILQLSETVVILLGFLNFVLLTSVASLLWKNYTPAVYARKYILTGSIILLLFFVSYDLSGGNIDYTETFKNSTEYDFSGEATVGSFTARNSFQMPRLLDNRNFSACVYPDGRKRQVPVFMDDDREIIGRGEVLQSNLYVSRETFSSSEVPSSANISVREKCPFQSPNSSIVIPVNPEN